MIPTDPLYAQQWHFDLLANGRGRVLIERIWDEFSGTGVHVGVYDTGLQLAHPDLDDNYDASREVVIDGVAISGDIAAASQRHGTAVAGIIGAELNGEGVVGVAWGAALTSVNIFDSDSPIGDFSTGFLQAVHQMANFDVTNNSWGSDPDFFENLTDPSTFGFATNAAFEFAVQNGRGGLGTSIVKSNGNENLDANGEGLNSSRYTISVNALLETGFAASYSSFGANTLVSAPGGDNGSNGTRLVTTADLLGTDGYNGIAGSQDYTNSMNGTSAAAPMVSGVIALMLEANPGLGWRDVQSILAQTAFHTGSDFGTGPTGNEDFHWFFNGAVSWNGGGLHFSEDYGYGNVDPFGAVRMAEAYAVMGLAPQTSANEVMNQSEELAVGLAVPDNNSVVSYSFDFDPQVVIEHIDVTIFYSGDGFPGDLTIELVSPDGTAIEIATGNIANQPFTSWMYGIDGLRGELAQGAWTLNFHDVVDIAEATVDTVQMTVYGTDVSPDDVYHFTDEFGAMAALDATRTTIDDANGGTDWINAAAVSSNSAINLNPGGVSVIDGIALFIPGGSDIENAIAGDGDDVLVGNLLANRLYGGRGDDTYIVDGLDDLVGENAGQGTDTVRSMVAAGEYLLPANVENLIVAGGDAKIIGNSLDNVMTGNAAGNEIDGAGGNDLIEGDGGDDLLQGGLGDDMLRGGLGDDTFTADSGDDAYVGGAGGDTISYAGAAATVFVTLAGGTGTGADFDADTLSQIENVTGGSGNDFISGDGAANVLNGGVGTDTLSGLGGGDSLLGGEGDDGLHGGVGNDVLNGGDGSDTATFTGLRAAYALNNLGAGNVRVVGADGDDMVSAVEKLVFNNVTLNWPPTGGNDFNADAFGDVLWRNTVSGQVRTWELDGANGAGIDNYGAANVAWHQVAAEDFNADGKGDILWRNTTTGQVATWELNGTGGFAFDSYGAAGVVWQSLGAGDFNGDGKGDVLFRNSNTGQVATWELNGAGGFSFDSYGIEAAAWKIAGIGDFNDDGHDDILWRNSTNGQVKTWELNGSGGVVSDSYGGAGLAWHIYGVGDFNADGKDDILWRNETTGVAATWELNGSGGFNFDNYGGAGLQWTVMHATDTNSDGKDDILWRNGTTGQVAAWELNGAGGMTFRSYGTNTLHWQIFDGNFEFV